MKRQVFRKLSIWCIAVVAAALVWGCGGKPAPKGEPIVGTYYCDASDGEYTLTLGEFVYTLAHGGESESGEYTVKDGVLTMTASGEVTMTAQRSEDGTLRVAVGYALPMRFLPKIEYTVTYDAGEGSAAAPAKAVNGKSVYTLPVSVREGYIFAGWYLDKDTYKQPFVFGETAVTGDVTLYARWVRSLADREFTATFDYGDGTTVTIPTANGKVFYAPVSPAGEFEGWWTSVEGDGDKLTARFESGVTIFDRDTVLYPVFARKVGTLSAPLVQVEEKRIYWKQVTGADKYHVTVAPRGGDAVADADVTKTSYAFDFSTVAAGEYTVTVTAFGDGEDALVGATTVRSYANRMLRRVEIFEISGDTLTFEPISHADRYYVTAVCADAAHNAEMTRYDCGSDTSFSFGGCTMGEDGIVFTVVATGEGWAESVSATYTCVRTLAAPAEFAADEDGYLTWRGADGATSYAVTVDAGSGAAEVVVTEPRLDLRAYGKGDISVTVTPLSRTYLSPTATNYVYSKDALAAPASFAVQDAQYLVWGEDASAIGYEVRIDGGAPISVTDNRYDLLALSAGAHTATVRAIDAKGKPSAWSDAFSFNNADIRPSGLRYEAGIVYWNAVVGKIQIDGYRVKIGADGEIADVNKNITQKAVRFSSHGVQTVYVCSYVGETQSEWVALEVPVYRMYLRGGDTEQTLYFAKTDTIALPTDVTKTGYAFTGWYDAETGGRQFLAKFYEVEQDTTLYAHWAAKSYTVTFALEGGSGAATTAEVTFDSPYTWDIPTAATADLGFAGWYTGVNGSGTRLTDADGASLRNWTADGSLTVYACYRAVLSFALMKDGTYAVMCGEGAYSVSSITVPEKYEGKLVTIVDAYAFRNCVRLRSLSLPDTLTVVEAETAFIGCNALQTLVVRTTGLVREVFFTAQNNILVFKNNTTGYYEIKYVPRGLTGTITVPDDATQIPGGAFENVSASVIVVSASVVRIEKDAFAGSRGLTEVRFAAGDDALDIAEGAFGACTDLTTVKLPARYRKFNPRIFSRCDALVSVFIEQNDDYAAIEYESGNYMVTNRNKNTVVYLPTGVTTFTVPAQIIAFGESAFVGSQIERVSIPATVTRVGKAAFSGCTNLREVRFLAGGQAPVVIEDNAFNGCTRLSSVTFEDGSRVSEIGAGVFGGCTQLQTFTFPRYLVRVGANAFENCRTLHTVSFANGGQDIAFAEGVFRNCRLLTTVRLPASVSKLYSSMFEGCESLSSIVVDSANPYFTAEEGVLYNKAKTEVLFVPQRKSMKDFALAPTVEKIGESVFAGRTTLTNFVIGNRVTEIGAGAFADCTNLKTVTFESGREEGATLSIGAGTGATAADKKGAFAGCAVLERIDLPAGLKGVPAYTFYECTSLRAVTFGEGIESIGAYAFYRASIANPVFPSTLATVGAHAFERVSYDTAPPFGELVFAEGLTEVGDGAFRYTGYTSVSFPSTVTKLGTELFYRGGMQTVTFAAGGTEPLVLSDSIFADAPIASLSLPERLQAIPAYMLGYAGGSYGGGMTELTVPASVTTVGDYAFSGAGSLRKITFAASEKPISFGTSVFNGCGGLRTVLGLGERLPVIPQRMFSGCAGLTSYDFTGVTEIGAYAFANTGLTSIVLGEGLTRIGANAFAGTKSTSVILPASVTEMGEAVFYNCTRLSTVEFASGGSADLTIPDGEVYGSAPSYPVFYGCSSLTTVTGIPARLKKLPSNLFYGCASLATVTFEKGGTAPLELGVGIFGNCAALESLTLPARTGTAPAKTMFTNCRALTAVHIDTSDTAYAGVRKYVSFEGGVYEADGAGVAVTAVFMPIGKSGVVTIPGTVTLVNDNVYDGCTAITGFTFASGDAPLTLGNSSSASNSSYYGPFRGCTNASFTSIALPARLVKLGTNAFNGLANLTSITFEAGTADLEIGAYAFAGTGVSALTLPDRVVRVGASLFYNCKNLTSVTMPSSAAGLEKALFGSKIADLTLSGGGATLEGGALYNADKTVLLLYTGSATELTIPASVTAIAEGVFMNNTALTRVTVAEGSNLASIGKQAFYGCSHLERFDLPHGLTSIGEQAFYNCGKLESVVIPATVRDTADGDGKHIGIGKQAFYGCKLVREFSFAAAEGQDGDLTIGDGGFNGVGQNAALEQKINLAVPDRVIEIGATGFGYVKSVKTITFGANSRLVSIGASAFQGAGLTSFVIPACMTEVPSDMFNYCLDLRSVTFAGTTVLKIGRNAFNGTAIAEIEIPDSVSVIEYKAFGDCARLTQVQLPSALVELGDGVFEGCGLTSIRIPGSVTTMGRGLFRNCKQLDSVIFSEGVTSLPAAAEYGNSATGAMFEGCALLREVYLPSTMTAIGAFAFYKAGAESASLDITVPAAVATLGKGAFRESGITSLTFENGSSVTEIGEEICKSCPRLATAKLRGLSKVTRTMFSDSRLLSEVLYADALVEIGEYAFQSCTALTFVEVSSKLQSVGYSSFSGCTRLTSFDLPRGLKVIGEYTFYHCDALTEITGWDNVEEIGASAFRCTGLAELRLPASLRTVGRLAFAQMPALTTVLFDDGATTIGSEAFGDCAELTRVRLPSTLTALSGDAFDGCSKLTAFEMAGEGGAYRVDGGILYNADRTALVAVPKGLGGVPVLPSTLTQIGAYAFTDTKITSIVVPEGVTSIGNYAFYGCTRLQSVSLPASLVEIGSWAFRAARQDGAYVTSLTTVTFAADCELTSIGDYAFYGDTGIAEIVIPRGVRQMGSSVFAYWTSAQTIYFDVASPTWENTGFGKWNGDCGARIVWA